MLEELFAGEPGGDLLPTQFTEIAWEKGEVYKEIKRMKVQKSADDCGLVPGVRYVPDFFIDTVMRIGQVPTDWRKTSFKMLPKTMRAKIFSEYRPIATIRLFNKFLAYMILGRVETQLETHQPEKQHENKIRFSGWQTCGRTFCDYALSLRQTFQRKRANLDCQPGLVKGFRPSTLASTMARSSEQGLSEHMI